MLGMAQRSSQMGDSQSQNFGGQSLTPFKTPSHSVNMPRSQVFSKEPGSSSGMSYHHYAGSTSSTTIPSQPFEMSQHYGTSADIFSSQKRAPPSLPPVGDPGRGDHKLKSERFFKELQGVLSAQLDRLRDDMARDLHHFKDVDSDIKKSLGLDVSALSDQISGLKDDLKSAINSFSVKVGDMIKEQDREVQNLCSKLNHADKKGKPGRLVGTKALEDSLNNAFQFLKREVSDLNEQIHELKQQMKTDTDFAIERIKNVKENYCEKFSLQAQRQTMIHEKFVNFLEAERKKPNKRESTAGQSQAEASGVRDQFDQTANLSKKFERKSQNSQRQGSQRGIGHLMDEERPSEPVSVHSNAKQPVGAPLKRQRSLREESGQISPEELSRNVSCNQSVVNLTKSNKNQWDISDPGHQDRIDSLPSDSVLVNRQGKWHYRRKRIIKEPKSFKPSSEESKNDFGDKFAYLKISPEEALRLEREKNKKGKKRNKSQSVEKVLTPREERLLKRREIRQQITEKETALTPPRCRPRTVINKEEEAAKEKAVEKYGEVGAKAINQASQMVKQAEKTVGKMKGRLNLTLPLNNL